MQVLTESEAAVGTKIAVTINTTEAYSGTGSTNMWLKVGHLQAEAGNSFPKRIILFLRDATAPSGPGPPYYPDITITVRHITLSRVTLDE
jgi:hypothetical protein